MKYKSIPFTDGAIGVWESDQLQKHFDEGWEYVDSISQTIAMTSSTYNRDYGKVLVILKKEDKVML